MLARWLEQLVKRGRLLSFIALGFMAVVVIVDIATPSSDPKLPWDAIGGFAAVMGFVGCVFFIALAKGLGTFLLYRPEDYYGEINEHEPPPAASADQVQTEEKQP